MNQANHMRARLLRVVPAALALAVCISAGQSFFAPTAMAARLRAEPNLSAPALALISASEDFKGSGLSFDDIYDKLEDPALEQPSEKLLAHIQTDGTALNVRSGPGTSFTVLGTAASGSFLTVLRNENGWCTVLYQEQIGYVSADYVELMTQADYEAYQASAAYLGEQIVAYSKNFLGRPYVYGGNGPDSFDCSGFVKYVYKNFGYGLNRTASDQLKNGVSVEKDALVPGDLVFFRTPGTVKPVSHVGLYIGNGDFIHAANTNYQVRIDNLASGYYAGVYVYGRHII